MLPCTPAEWNMAFDREEKRVTSNEVNLSGRFARLEEIVEHDPANESA